MGYLGGLSPLATCSLPRAQAGDLDVAFLEISHPALRSPKNSWPSQEAQRQIPSLMVCLNTVQSLAALTLNRTFP